MGTFFTADTHFGDPNILRQRRFASVAEHDSTLIDRWNTAVAQHDEVWHLGDFANGASREECAAIFMRLNGVKRLIRGNHDSNRVLDLPWAQPPLESLRVMVRSDDGKEWRLFLAHYPHRAWPGLWRGTRHLYGHIHASLADTCRSCDVGVDAWNYCPVQLPAIVERQDAAAVLPEELELKRELDNARAAAM